MAGNDLWKYCEAKEAEDVLRSFHLLEGTGVSDEKYLACLYAVSNHTEEHYHTAVIQKKNGGMRKLSVPDTLLRTIQRNIVKNVLCERSVSQYATAYRKKASVMENARPHVGAEMVMKLDIKDFFDCITFQMVYQYAFPAIYYPPSIRMLLTSLCCRNDCLPQGAPSSPAISNLAMRSFDQYMGAWCGERQMQYTRYCDDLTFSGTFDQKEVKQKVRNFLHVLGFELNRKKTRVQNQSHRQTVTGLVVNEKMQVSREYRNQLRAEIYYCQKYGVTSHLNKMGNPAWMRGDEPDVKRYLQYLLGKINYVLAVNPHDGHFCKKREELSLMVREISTRSNTL